MREVAGEFRKRKIPCDVIWMDIDYMDGYRCFTFSPKDFPDPTKLNADLHGMGFHAVWMIDPGIKDEAGYSVHDSGTAADVWVKAADGKANFAGKVWPGMCLFPDFTMKATRAWWAGLYKNFLATGVDGVWNDMNEPAVFELKGHTMPEDNVHRADPELGGTAPHSRYHNIYGMQMVRATREGILAARPDKRPFVLSRANYLGGQRYAAAWTGDNAADWAHLRDSIPMALNLGLSGQPFAGPDIGGYKGNGPKDQEGRFFARWMGIGSLLPFARAHTEKGSINKEPWAFGPEVEATCRAAIERRYRLMPYLYTLFREASVSGMPVARPLFFADPADEKLRDQDTSFLLGGDLLVQARIGEQSQWPAVMPKGAWRDLWQVSGPRGDDLPRLFIRAGAIIPSRDVTQYTAEKPLEELRLIINLGPDKKASGAFYDDAGDGFAYQKGDYRLSTFTAELKGDELVVREQSHEGERPKAWKRLIVESPGAAPWKSVRIEE